MNGIEWPFLVIQIPFSFHRSPLNKYCSNTGSTFVCTVGNAGPPLRSTSAGRILRRLPRSDGRPHARRVALTLQMNHTNR